MRKAPRRKKQGSWPEGKRASILDNKAEGNISPDKGKAGDSFIACIIVKCRHLHQAFLEVSVRILSWWRLNQIKDLHGFPLGHGRHDIIKLGLTCRNSLQAKTEAT